MEMEMKQIESRDQFPFLLNEMGLVGIGVEVGVQKGVYAKFLLDNWKGEKLYLVDAWRQFKSNEVSVDNPDRNVQLNNFAETFMNTYFHYDKAVIIKDLSVSASHIFPDGFFDFIYVDAAHDEINVMKDLEAWYPKVKNGGIFAGHDYFNGFVHIQINGVEEYKENKVKSVVDDFFCFSKVLSTPQDEYPSWYIKK
jgi:Methyltransferase domain